jgi:hypothetical protein
LDVKYYFNYIKEVALYLPHINPSPSSKIPQKPLPNPPSPQTKNPNSKALNLTFPHLNLQPP